MNDLTEDEEFYFSSRFQTLTQWLDEVVPGKPGYGLQLVIQHIARDLILAEIEIMRLKSTLENKTP